MNKFHVKATLLKAKDDVFTFIATDETLDRHGEVIPIESWDLKDFKRNPVLLINHDYKVENIVGAAKNLRFEDGKMLFDAVFHGITQLSREVMEMVRQNFLNTVSVGFMRQGPAKDGDREKNQLFEISFVPVPANPSAERIKAAIAKSVEENDKKELVNQWVEKQTEVMEMQTIICSKEKFETKEAAAKWVDDHDFDSSKMSETDDAYRFRQFDQKMCQADTEKTIELDEGVKGSMCRMEKAVDDTEQVSISKQALDELKSQSDELAQYKEGRVISAKNRTLITDAIDTMKKSIAALEGVLQATNSERDDEKGREPKMVRVGVEHDVPSPVVRALQEIASITNLTLYDAKKNIKKPQ